MRNLLRAGADPSAPVRPQSPGDIYGGATPLHFAIREGSAEAVRLLFGLKGVAHPALPGSAREAAGAFAAGFSAWILASVGILAGCSILHGLPLVLCGVGVLARRGWARWLALVFAFLGALEGVGFLLGPSSPTSLALGGAFLAYAFLSFAALLGREADAGFGGAPLPAPAADAAPPPPASSSAASWGVAGAMLLCGHAILLMALRPVSFTVAWLPPPTL